MSSGTVSLNEIVRDATSVPAISSDGLGIAAALRRLLDIEAIRGLGCLYSRAVDDGELDTLVRLFTPDGAFVRLGVETRGREPLKEMWVASRARYTYTRHATYNHVVVPETATTAYGWAAGQAELVLGSTTLMAAYRYDDRYAKHDGRWLFDERVLAFSYVVPAESLPSVLGEPDRLRWPGQATGLSEYPPPAYVAVESAQERPSLGGSTRKEARP